MLFIHIGCTSGLAIDPRRSYERCGVVASRLLYICSERTKTVSDMDLTSRRSTDGRSRFRSYTVAIQYPQEPSGGVQDGEWWYGFEIVIFAASSEL